MRNCIVSEVCLPKAEVLSLEWALEPGGLVTTDSVGLGPEILIQKDGTGQQQSTWILTATHLMWTEIKFLQRHGVPHSLLKALPCLSILF